MMNIHHARHVTVVLSLVSVLGASRTAYSQVATPQPVPDLTQPAYAAEKMSVGDRPHPEYDQPGIRYESYVIKPTIAIGEAVDSNILGSSTFEQSDFITSVKPTLSIASDWTENAVSLYAAGDIQRYARYSSEDVDDFVVQADGRLDIDRGQTLRLRAGYQVGHLERYAPETQAAVSYSGGGTYARYPTEYSISTAQLSYVYSPSRLGFGIDATVNRYAYTNEPTFNGGLAIQGDQNRTEFIVTPRLSYELTPGYQAFIEGSGNWRQYESEFDASPAHFKRSSSGYAIAAGTQLNLGNLITGEIHLGYQNQDYDDARLNSASGLYLGASVLWNVTQLTSIKFTANRSLQETILIGSSSFWDTELRVTAEHELLRNILITAGLGLSLEDYQGINRSETLYSANVGARWRFTQAYSVGISGLIQHRSSNFSLDRFTRGVVAIDLKVSF